MIANISKYAFPGLGGLCVLGAVAVGVAVTKPVKVNVDGSAAIYTAWTPQQPELSSNVPTMDEVLEKHLFTKSRKASAANSFSDLLVKGVYVGDKGSVVLSLKSRPSVNLRIWQDNVSQVIKQISNPRDPRQTLVDFLNEWDIVEITMQGVTVEHFVTGERETYKVDYTPSKHVADNAENGYGQGMLAEAGSVESAKTVNRQANVRTQSAQGLMVNQLRNMMRSMSPDQRAAFAQRMGGQQQSQEEGGQNRQQNNQVQQNNRSKNSGSSGSSGSSSSGRRR